MKLRADSLTIVHFQKKSRGKARGRLASKPAKRNTPAVSDDADWRAEYPFTPRAFDVGGLKLNYVDEGSGPVLLFVHGNPTWSFAWRNMLKDLSRDYRVIAVDHIGCGLSDKPQKKYGYVLENHISNLVKLVDALDLRKVTLVGHDWGGCIGMGTAARRPDRFSRFILMNTAAFRSSRIPLRIRVCRIPVLGAIAVRGFNAFARAALFMAVEHRRRFTKRARAGFIAPYNSWANRIATHEFVKDIPLAARHRSYETLLEVETGLARFRDKPMLLLWGERDWCFTMHFYREWRRRFPEAKTITYPDAGHYVFEDAIDRMIPDVRAFLEETKD